MIFFNQLIKKRIEKKKFEKKIFKEFFEETEKKIARKECGHFKGVGRKRIFSCFGFVTKHKALDVMKLDSKVFFFIKKFMV